MNDHIWPVKKIPPKNNKYANTKRYGAKAIMVIIFSPKNYLLYPGLALYSRTTRFTCERPFAMSGATAWFSATQLFARGEQVIRQKDNRLCEASIRRCMFLLIDASHLHIDA